MGAFAAGRCSYSRAEGARLFVVGAFRSGALLLQKLSTSRFICRSSAPAANGAQRAPAGCNRSPARRGLWRIEHTASSPAWTIIPDGHDKQAAIDRRREEVSGGSNTQHQAPPGQSSRTDTISGFEEERANRKF